MKPVLWYHPVSGRVRFDGESLGPSWIPLYKKHEWVGLTDEEYTELWGKKPDLLSFFRKIEAKLKAKNS